ncbi:acyl-CoA carboxylase epsilon subunit [Streptomyces qinzhouensis]|uniref:Acyl-CoA carboxylase subunit epsilon n=1 Tax=Streptomyces qinzhouensis TaxID=2599401 RepID=A0A5B8JJG1_9ACTN|nr:acyl-CoA carboxylase epsilon subunit [Streptomyces qinzhouensis]QDY75204.1 acyl-CoA carboxylase subunit epsilon [Streptomyces qinzhouensis]QDY80594.1 acyl-CoA carboxylase subunit epsilon [Streptomyces qinzhouensis]
MEGAPAVLRLERGRACEEELAAVAVVLLALRGRGRAGPVRGVSPGWKWWERPGDYAAPGSWR